VTQFLNPQLNAEKASEGILDGFAYLQQCLEQKHTFGIVVGSTAANRARLIDRFTAGIADRHIARVNTPTSSDRRFLEDLLLHLGLESYEPSDACVDDLLKLLTFFLGHEARRGQMTVIIVEEVHAFGPRVMDAIQLLAGIRENGVTAALIVLTGSDALHRVLDSEGMAAVAEKTRERFDLDDATALTTLLPGPARPAESCTAELPEAQQDTTVQISVSLYDQPVGRFPINQERLLIGRSKDADIPIMSRYVSRYHALLINLPEGAYLVDLKSSNGTTVNSVPIRFCALKHADVISIGNYRLRYENVAGHNWPDDPDAAEGEDFTDTVIMRSALGIGFPGTGRDDED